MRITSYQAFVEFCPSHDRIYGVCDVLEDEGDFTTDVVSANWHFSIPAVSFMVGLEE